MAQKKDDLEAIKSSISEENVGWEASSNEIFELSEEEKKLLLGYVPGDDEPSLKEQELQSKANLSAYLAMLDAGDKGFGAPTNFDLRNVAGKNYITPVKNQASCGSCVAFGTVAAVEGTVRWLKKSPNLNVDFSEAQLFYCHARSEGRRCNNGWWVPPAMKAFRDKGVTDEAHYPYTAGDQNCTGLKSGWQDEVKKIKNYKSMKSIAEMKEWISTKGPVASCFTVYSDFFAYKSGVYKKTSGATKSGGHCVCTVGYSDSGKYWICKNSWGSNWGDQGYFKIAYGECGIDSEVWGVTGIQDTGWITAKITGLWANAANKNAFVYLTGEGWKKISNKNDTNFYLMLTQLAAAKGANKSVRVYVKNGKIFEIYA